MIVLSLFGGIETGMIALEKNEILVDKYYSSEFNKFPIKIVKKRYPNIICLGDILNWKEWNIPWKEINLIIAGSPCKGFSSAGKGLNFDDPQSKLFFIFIDILNHVKRLNPDVKFLLENVSMKKSWQKVINDYVGIFPVRINSSLVCAQTRDRLYWSNIRTKRFGIFGELHTDIDQPIDKKIYLKDILQPIDEIDEKYYISANALKRIQRKQYSVPKINPDKTGCMNTKNNSGHVSFDSGTTLIGIDINGKAPTQRAATGRCLDKKHNYQIIKLDIDGNKKFNQSKADCLTVSGNSGGYHSDMDIICVSMVGRKIDKNGIRKDYDGNLKSLQRLEYAPNGKTNCLTTVNKDNLLTDGYKLRRLTPIECERLQTIPDDYTKGVSDTQRYKMLGNAWTVDVIAHIFSYLKSENHES